MDMKEYSIWKEEQDKQKTKLEDPVPGKTAKAAWKLGTDANHFN